MKCSYFDLCGGCNFTLAYPEQIAYKKACIQEKFSPYYKGELQFFESILPHFRSRAEFKIYHEEDKIFYAMNDVNKKFLKIDSCPKVDIKIYNLMSLLLDKVQNSSLKAKLFGVEFLTSKEDILVILLYHKNIEDIKEDLEKLAQALGIKLLARSYKKKLVFGQDFLFDEVEILGKKYFYKFTEGAFIQPNRFMNMKMLTWVKENLQNTKDLLELYCGFGNFTLALSDNFEKVLATEISKQSINDANFNKEKNKAENITFLRMSSEDLMQAFAQVRTFERLKNVDLQAYNFSHILVDPPRAGLDDSVIDFIKNFENIIYISCNPETLKENLEELSLTHEVEKFAIFDQFAYSHHAECGIILRKKK